jgi:hypothetical protein
MKAHLSVVAGLVLGFVLAPSVHAQDNKNPSALNTGNELYSLCTAGIESDDSLTAVKFIQCWG